MTRKDKFAEAMTAVAAELTNEPLWESYAEYCQLRGQRNNEAARLAAERFLEVVRSWSFEERKRFGLWLMDRTGSVMERCGRSRFAIGGQSLIASREVIETVLLPTLVEWRNEEPNNPDPHFWLGLYAVFRGDEAPAVGLREAIRLDPAHGPARAALTGLILDAVSYAQHELPSGYLGEPADDLTNLSEAEALLTEAVDPDVRMSLQEKINTFRASAEDWIKLRGQLRGLDWTSRISIWQARRLARLGGSEPDLTVAPRRRARRK